MRTLFQSLSGCQGVETGLNNISLITQFMDSLGTEFRFLKDKLHRAFVENESGMQVKPYPTKLLPVQDLMSVIVRIVALCLFIVGHYFSQLQFLICKIIPSNT